MARLTRLYAPETAQRVLQRAAKGRGLFYDVDDYRFFVELIAQAAKAHGISLHAYVLLPNEVQLLTTPTTGESVPGAMQAIGRRYAPYLNRKTGESGRIWDGRYRSTVVDAGRRLLDVMRYIEAAPIDAGLVATIDEWPWSSYRHHVGRETTTVVSDHSLYWALGNTPFERQAAYAALSAEPLPPTLKESVREATEKGWALGDAEFIARMEREATRRPKPSSPGRPKKSGP